jgi:hypothetical protein
MLNPPVQPVTYGDRDHGMILHTKAMLTGDPPEGCLSSPTATTSTMTITEQPLTWRCSCGHRQWVHYEHCTNCGEARPAPPPEAKPSPRRRDGNERRLPLAENTFLGNFTPGARNTGCPATPP